MSSRLFQNIREKQGLAYSVFSELNPVPRHRLPGGLRRHVGRSARKVVACIWRSSAG